MPSDLSTDLPVVPFVLMYHSVARFDDDPNAITTSPGRFAQQMRWLARRRLRGTSMGQLLRAAARGDTAGLVGLTFDDGYADFATDVVPVLARHGFTATAFIVAGKLGGTNDWDAGPVKTLMSADDIRRLARAGVEIGSHGLGHLSLSAAGDSVLRREIGRSREVLQEVLDAPVPGFCYPYGALSDAAATAAQAVGYDYAVSTWEHARRDRYAMPRTYVGERDSAPRMYAKLIRHRLKWGRR
jgi:peptidoglycan/xylan/chitin deacetylase (PgdA/CDA1 family)